jgi:EAL domain-containing protein (putative c-di-GMP-specific phosphodiesterase class I)
LPESAEISIHVSVGIARTPLDSTSAAELVGFAGCAMTAAKRAGGRRLAFFDAALRRAATERAQIAAELRAALERDDNLVYYQPKVHIPDGSLAGVEALVRLRDAEGHIVSPNTFISVAEETGLIDRIGDVVLRKAVEQCQKWLDTGLRIPVSINASPVQFERVLSVISEYDLPAHMIEVEIPETSVMRRDCKAEYRLKSLRSSGIDVSIDDFGTGFSNLSLLTTLPYDTLKIDKSLIDMIGSDRISDALLEGLFRMTAITGRKTVAEGVETFEQLAFLERHGCTLVPGLFNALD